MYHKTDCPTCKGLGYIKTGRFVKAEAMGVVEVQPTCDTCKGQGETFLPISDMDALLKIVGNKATKRVNDPSDAFYKKGRLKVANMVVIKSSDPTLGDERPDCVFLFDKDANFIAVGVFE
jgi:hypothetical protein